MKYQKQVSLGGAWVKAADLKSGVKAKIVSETVSQPSLFLNKDGSPKSQDVAKLRIEGQPEPLNCSLNRATINALVDAFGEDSKDWQGHTLTVETEKVRVGGVARVALYLVPDGYVKIDDANGYAVITKQGTTPEALPEVQISNDDLPF